MNIVKTVTQTITRFLTLCCCLHLILSSSLTTYANFNWPDIDTDIQALAGIVIDADSGAVLYEKNADTPYPPASTVKILTALVVLEEYKSMDDIITFTTETADPIEPDAGNRLNTIEGDRLTVRDCLYSMLLISSNQSANALVTYIAGDIDSFVEIMNEKATELGLVKSHFDNPSGLSSDNQMVTARELAVIARAAYNNPELLKISKAITYELTPTQSYPNGHTIQNEHRLLYTTDPNDDYYYPSAVAGKTGYLQTAGNTLVTYAEQNGKRLISIVLKGHHRQYFADSKAMLEFGFSHFDNYTIPETELTAFTDTELEYLQREGHDKTNLTVSGNMSLTLPKDIPPDHALRKISQLSGGMHPKGAVAVLEYRYQQKVIGTIYIVDTAELLPDNLLPIHETLRQAQDLPVIWLLTLLLLPL